MAEWIIHFIESSGYLGIVALMALENIFPPIPSELIMPFAGLLAAQHKLNIFGVVAAGAVGSVAGTLPWYWLGRAIGRERLGRWVDAHGRWFTMDRQELQSAEDWLRRHGNASLFFGRLLPALRSVISLPAGFIGVPMPSFLLWSTLGTTLWSGLLAGLGYALESRYERIASEVDLVSKIVLAVLVAIYLWRVIRFDPDKKRQQA